MRQIELNATSWKTGADLYDAFFDALGSPKWHGTNVNALVESMVYGGINEIEPPYTIVVKGTDKLPRELQTELSWLKEDLAKARNHYRDTYGRDVDAVLVTEP